MNAYYVLIIFRLPDASWEDLMAERPTCIQFQTTPYTHFLKAGKIQVERRTEELRIMVS